MLTRVDSFNGWFAKREDEAEFINHERASGAKMRQYMAMAAKHPKGTPMVVGCSAFASQQIYVADAAARVGTKAFIFVPQRREKTAATKWCEDRGANVFFVKPGYPSVYRKAAREKAEKLGGTIRWNNYLAVRDTIDQVGNISRDVARVLVPTASGLTAAGVIAGLANLGVLKVEVVCIAVSDLSSREKVIRLATKYADIHRRKLPPITWLRVPGKYGSSVHARLPDDTLLDSNYAAKAMQFIQTGDLLWVSGMRPYSIN